jgi:hypothetical protein
MVSYLHHLVSDGMVEYARLGGCGVVQKLFERVARITANSHVMSLSLLGNCVTHP